MKTFKKFLAESSVASFDVTSMDVEDIIDCQRNAGYEISRSEMKAYIDCRYEGFKNGSHVYIMMMQDDNDEEGGYYLARMYVTLGREGKIVAEPSGIPFREGTEEEILAAFQRF